MRRSPQSIENIERQIAEAAIALGPNLSDFSVQDLAKKAGFAIGTIYRVLPTRDSLKEIVQKRAETMFDAVVLAAIPAKLDAQERFNSVMMRIMDFAKGNPKAAQYLAFNGFSVESNFRRAILGFIKEFAPIGFEEETMAKLGFSLIWGPIATLLSSGEDLSDEMETIAPKIWKSIAN